MAQEVRLKGATYSDVPSISLPDSNGNYHSFVDATTASSWTKIAETTYTISSTNTSGETIGYFETGNDSIYTSGKIVYVRIRDTAGKRAGYFYGSDHFFLNHLPANDPSSTSVFYQGTNSAISYTADSAFNVVSTAGVTGYGVYPDYVYADGKLRIRARYNSSHSLTIDGTYKVEVYTLDWPDGTSPFT